uniref:Uncharacterized protein n=1 Tax=Arundo donax TaxID=35708 RepID=A0A0A9BK20_ARUDO
MQDIVLDLI